MRIYNANGVAVIEYTYDAWGNYKKTKLIGSTSADRNGLLYRGYYYDTDLKLYYLGARYYDANIGRFINADELVAGVGGEMRGNNLYVYAFNNPIMYSDFDGNWPSWNELINWCENALETWKKESFLYNVVITNISADFGVGIGVGGEIKLGKFSISLMSRVDLFGVELNNGEIKIGHHGKSEASIQFGNIYFGKENRTYESYDGNERYRVEGGADTGLTYGKAIGVVIAGHYDFSVSFVGIYDSLVSYGKARSWW